MAYYASILLVDDYAPFRSACAIALSREGYDVLLASNGRMALEIVHRLRDSVRLMIVDIRLPDMSGAQLVKEAAAHIPVIFISGDADALPADIAAPEPVSMALVKPFEMAELLRHVRRLIAVSGEQRQPEAET